MTEQNQNSRLEAFCDGVFAIALTLLIIDIKIPATKEITTTEEMWLAIVSIVPAISAFILSFIVILITWVNHHNSLKLIHKSSPHFVYANGLLLLTVVFVPFPTSMMGEYLLTNHLAPAAILYNITLAIQSLGWILLCNAAIGNKLTMGDHATITIRRNRKFGYFAFVLYSLFAVLAIWIPLTISIITASTWIFWLVYGISIKHDEVSQVKFQNT
jgi:uncharacterized membrane protein